jgi:hypothetical protein
MHTCRAFLELAKLWASKLINIMFSDAGGTVMDAECYSILNI